MEYADAIEMASWLVGELVSVLHAAIPTAATVSPEMTNLFTLGILFGFEVRTRHALATLIEIS